MHIRIRSGFLSKPYIYIIAFFGILYCLISLVNHYYFRTYAFDLGIINNSIWDYAHFRWNSNTVMQPSFDNILSDHFTLLPILFSPLYWVFGSYTLLVVQIGALLFGGYGIYKLVYLKTENKFLASLATIHFFSFWGIYSALGFDYHDNVIAAALLPMFFYYLECSRWKYVWLYYILILISKENMALWMVFVCLGAAILAIKDTKKRNRLIAMSVLSGIYMICIIKFVIPFLGNADRAYLHFHYSALGTDMKEAFLFIIQSPYDVFMLLFEDPSGQGAEVYKKQLHIAVLLSGGYFLFCRPQYLMMLVPIYAQKLFNDDIGKWGVSYHYCIEFAPVIVIAAYDFISVIKNNYMKYVMALGSLILTIYATYNILENQVIWWQNKDNVQFYKKEHYENKQLDIAELNKIIKDIPFDAAVSTQSNLVSHLSFRDKIYQFPVIEDASYILLVPAQEGTYPLSKEDYAGLYGALIRNKEWKIEFQSAHTLLLKRN